MLEILNCYAHGFAVVPALRACRRLNPFSTPVPATFTASQLAQESGANPGVLQVILRQLESLGLIVRTGQIYFSDGSSLFSAFDSDEILQFYCVDPDRFLMQEGAGGRIRPWVSRILNGWGTAARRGDLLDGPFIVPVLLGLSRRMTPEGTLDTSGFAEDTVQELDRLLTGKGFTLGEGGRLRLTEAGRYLLERVPILATLFSYGPMLARIETLLFGNPREVFARDGAGHETHVDRHLNVVGSGFQHEKYFGQIDNIVARIFDGPDPAAQPRYVADMGCGDGSLLRRIYTRVKESTARGQMLDRVPLTLIGLDYNELALEATGRTLEGIPNILLKADIGRPQDILAEFAKRGIGTDEVLHVRSFLDHDRPFVAPSPTARAAFRSRIPAESVSVNADGGLISPGTVMESLVQHLENWAATVNRHGLVLLEVHCLSSGLAARFLDESESLHFDAYHGLSLQHLVEAHTFRLALAEAGLFPRAGYSRRFPQTFPYTRITLDWLEKRDYQVRHALPTDLPDLLALEAACWPVPLRANEEDLCNRLTRFPEGQFVLEMGDRVVAVLYSQRIGSVSSLEGSRFAEISQFHDPAGPVLQLLGLNVDPDPSHQTLGAQLADSVFDWCRLRGDIESVAGITRCRDYPEESVYEEYVLRVENGAPADAVLRFHIGRGARIRSVVPNYRPEDKANKGNGVLIEYDLAGERAASAPRGDATEAAVMACVARFVSARSGETSAPSPETPLRELGLDSLDLMELRNLLNRQFSAGLDSSFFFEYSTPRAIAGYLSGRGSRRIASEPARTAAPEHSTSDDAIAIVGVSCRFPGADGPEEFWSLLERGESSCGRVPADRWDASVGSAEGAEFGGFLSDVDRFDADFFRISPREANWLDPQQRLLLEESWRALESAGIDPDTLRGSRAGIFIGIFSHDYETLSRAAARPGSAQPYLATGNSAATASGRIAYFLDLRGPALSIDTACSSSLVALDLACQSVRNGECSIALAGGVNLMLSPELSTTFGAAGMLAADGCCKTFDASADGYVRSEGCAVVVLKRLRDALADGDDVLALVRGTAVNQDGTSNGLTAPNGAAQEAVIRAALAAAGCEAREISCVEAHGTGTSLGDPVEIKALGTVYSEGREAGFPLTLGSVKTNIGHAEAAAGMAGLLKTVLALRHRRIPRHLHFSQLNPHISLAHVPARIATEASEWAPGATGRRIAGISSFGFSGTNAHSIVEEAPERPRDDCAGWQIFALSAGSEAGLSRLAASYVRWLDAHPEVPLRDVCHTANAGRKHFGVRTAVVGDSADSIRNGLRSFERFEQSKPRVAFLYTGQGSQYAGMGRGLYETSAVFREAIERCDSHLKARTGDSVVELIYGSGGGLLNETRYTQPAIFSLEYALTELWRSLGVEPEAVAGHSVGEFAAAVTAGVLSLEDGLSLIAERARLMQDAPRGSMLAVLADDDCVESALRGLEDRARVAAYNARKNTVVSGEESCIATLEEMFMRWGIRTVRLNTSHAFHSHLMDGVLEPLNGAASLAPHAPPRIPLVSNLTGRFADRMESGYWARHARQPVRFSESISCLEKAGYDFFIEIGPKPVLMDLGRKIATGGSLRWEASLRPGRDDWRQMLETVRELYVRGAAIRWSGVARGARKTEGLPGYPFEKQRFWLPDPEVAAPTRATRLPGDRIRSPLRDAQFQAFIGAEEFAGHCIRGRVIVPAAAYLEAWKQAALESVEFEQPLALEREPVVVQPVLVQTTVGADGTLSVHSFRNGEWQRHAVARAAVGSVSTGEELTRVRARLSQPCQAAAFYREGEASGAEYGADYQLLSELYRGDGQALGLVIPRGDSVPALDAALQVALAAIPHGLAAGLPLPFSIERFIRPQDFDSPFLSYARVECDASRHTVRAELTFYALDGKQTGAVRGLVLRVPGPVAATDKWREWLCRMEWQREEQPFADAAFAINSLAVPFAVRALAELNGDPIAPRHDALLRRLARMVHDAGKEPGDPEALLKEVRASYPDAEPELRLLERCGRSLAEVLRGKMNPLELLFPNGDISDCRDLYANSPAFSRMNRVLRQTVTSIAAGRRGGRILEVGGGTGAATEALLPHLDSGTTSYTFTDVSSLFPALLAEQLRAYPFVTCQTLDIEKSPESQGFVNGSFDIVLASNVLHATADLAVSLRHARQLLAPGGALVLLEVTEPQPWIDLVFGLTEGWWRFTDRAARQDYPLLSVSGWKSVLARAGFASTEVRQPADGVYGQAVFVARETPVNQREWLIFGDRELVREGHGHLADFDTSVDFAGCAGVIYAGAADWDRLLPLVHDLLQQKEPPALWLVTRNAVAVTEGDRMSGVAQSSLHGIARVLANEHPELRCRLADIDGSPESVAALWEEILHGGSSQEEIALRGGERYVSRFKPWSPVHEPAPPISEERHAPGPNEIEIRVEATGLNFRDVLIATGQYPGQEGRMPPLGVECSGIATATGEEVIAIAPECFGEYAVAKSALVFPKPLRMSFADAAGVAVPYLTAAYGLEVIAGMKRGDRVLIHAAAGGVGWAACQLARRAGAEVYATASRGKWEFLRAAGIRHIYDSRTTDFARQILADTGGAGVDIVLNSLAGEAAVRSYSLLGPQGTFVEIAKNSPVLGGDRCRAFDLLEVAEREPETIRALMLRLLRDIAEGTLEAPPTTVFPRTHTGEAFALMRRARHTGKIVISRGRLDAHGTYLITGGTGGLGIAVSRWLVANGARRLVLVSRTGPGAAALEAGAELTAAGASVDFVNGDAGNPANIEAMLKSIRRSGHPLCGVIHAAGVLDDGMIADQTPERFRTVMEPKAHAAWILHEATLQDRLQMFVLFSSVASLAGPQGQANHAAANAFLDGLAAQRRARGLAGIAINWGAWSGIGAAAGDDVGRRLRMKGIESMTPAEGIAALDFVLAHNPVQAAVLPIDWSVFAGSAPRFAEIRRTAARPVAASAAKDLTAALRDAPDAEREVLLREEVRAMLRKALGMKPGGAIPARRGFFELGLDSLGSVQMRNELQKLLGKAFPSSLLFDYPDVESLAAYLLATFMPEAEAVSESKPIEGAAIELLSDEEAERMLLRRLEQIGLS